MGRGKRQATQPRDQVALSDGDSRRRPVPTFATVAASAEAAAEVEEVVYVTNADCDKQAELKISDKDVLDGGGDFVDGAVIKCLELHSPQADVTDVDGEDPGRYIEITVEDGGKYFVYLCKKA